MEPDNPAEEDFAGETNAPPAPPLFPWWRWNLITLAGALFLVFWLRFFVGFTTLSGWLTASIVFFVWLLAPTPFVDWSFLLRLESTAFYRQRRVQFLSTCRAIALALVCCALTGAVLTLSFEVTFLFDEVTHVDRWEQFFRRLVTSLEWLFLECAVAAVLWFLAGLANQEQHAPE